MNYYSEYKKILKIFYIFNMFRHEHLEEWCDDYLGFCIANNVISTGCLGILCVMTFQNR